MDKLELVVAWSSDDLLANELVRNIMAACGIKTARELGESSEAEELRLKAIYAGVFGYRRRSGYPLIVLFKDGEPVWAVCCPMREEMLTLRQLMVGHRFDVEKPMCPSCGHRLAEVV